MKRLLAVLVLAIMVFSLFSGCGATQPQNTTTEKSTVTAGDTSATTVKEDPNAEAFTISNFYWKDPNLASTKDFQTNVEKLFSAKYPNAKIQWNLTNGTDWSQVLKAKLASNSADDVFWHQSDLKNFAKANYMVDLSDQPWASNLLDFAKACVSDGGKVYAAPDGFAGWGLFYNKKVFSDLSLTVPKNWNELYDVCEIIKAKGITPFINGHKDIWTCQGTFDAVASTFLYAANPNFAYDLYDGKAKINGPEVIAMFDKLQTLVQKGYFPKNILSIGYDQAESDFAQGKAAFIFMGSFFIGDVLAKFNTQLGFIPIADDNGNYIQSGTVGSFISVNAGSKMIDRAKDLVAAEVDESSMQIIDKDSEFSPFKNFEIKQTADGMNEFGHAFTQYKLNLQPDQIVAPSAQTVINQTIAKIMAGQKLDPKDLDEADKNNRNDIAQVNLPSK